MAVAGIIRQQACGLGVWCPKEEGEGVKEEEEAAPVRTCTREPWRLVLTHSFVTATTRPRQRLLSLRLSEA